MTNSDGVSTSPAGELGPFSLLPFLSETGPFF
jgi:hypothetical protein